MVPRAGGARTSDTERKHAHDEGSRRLVTYTDGWVYSDNKWEGQSDKGGRARCVRTGASFELLSHGNMEAQSGCRSDGACDFACSCGFRCMVLMPFDDCMSQLKARGLSLYSLMIPGLARLDAPADTHYHLMQ